MKIWHRGKLAAEHGDFLQRQAVRIKPIFRETNPNRPSLYEFIIDEEDSAWPEVKRRLEGGSTYVRTEFTKEEIAQAEWSIAWAEHSIDGFVPEEKWWCDLYYSDRCKSCGTGWRQIAPFRIKKEAK